MSTSFESGNSFKKIRLSHKLETKFVAEKTNLPWDLTDNEDAGGGRVVFIRGDYSSNQDFHNKIIFGMRVAPALGAGPLYTEDPTNLRSCCKVATKLLRSWTTWTH